MKRLLKQSKKYMDYNYETYCEMVNQFADIKNEKGEYFPL